MKFALFLLWLGLLSTCECSLFGQSSNPFSNKTVYERLVSEAIEKLKTDMDTITYSIRIPKVSDPHSGIFIEKMVGRGFNFSAEGDLNLDISKNVSFNVYWVGNRNKFRREINTSFSASLSEENTVIFTKTYFKSAVDTISGHEVLGLESEGFRFSNDVSRELAKNSRRRILEPIFVLFGVTSTAYLLFTLRL